MLLTAGAVVPASGAPLVSNPASLSVPQTAAPISPTPTAASAAGGRLMSLDALRGFDMFWILGADAVIQGLGRISDAGPLKVLAQQFRHKAWDGFAFYDLIFPLFVFIVGVSAVFSLSKTLAQQGRAVTVRRVLRRAALLFLLGIFYSGGITNAWPDLRLLGVLQRIALAFAGAGLLFCFCRPRTLAAVAVALLAGYWALLTFVPIRDFKLDAATVAARLGEPKPALEKVRRAFDETTTRVTGHYEAGLNVTNHFDFEYLPGRKYDTYWDPEGVLSTPAAVATCLLGMLAGLLLRRADLNDRQKLARLAAAGVGALALGWLWHLQFPVVKKIWTSSFVLVAGGYSLLLLVAFYYVIDVRQWRRWCTPFVWVGMNAITLYVAANIIGFRTVARRLAAGDVKEFLDTHLANGAGDLLIAIAGLALVLWLARFLHRRQIFLRV